MSGFPRPDYRALDRYDPGRRPVEVDLSDNTNLWGTHPAALEVVRGADTDALARYPSLYADALRNAVSRRHGVPPENVCTGCGSDDVLDAAFRAAGPDGGVVRYAAPTFSMVEPLSRMNGRVPRGVAWSAALEDPERLLEDDPVLVYVCRPNNPTGGLAPREWIDELLSAASGSARSGGGRGAPGEGRRAGHGETPGPEGGGPLIVVDEAYADFAAESLLADAPGLPRLLVARTMSKAYGLAGMRVGWGVGSAEVVDEVEKSRGPYKVSRLAEAAAAAALDDEEGWTAGVVDEVLANRERLARALEERGLAPLPSDANFLLVPVDEGTAGRWGEALRARGVAVRPFPECPDVGDALRVTVGPWPLMERFLGAVDEVLETPRKELGA